MRFGVCRDLNAEHGFRHAESTRFEIGVPLVRVGHLAGGLGVLDIWFSQSEVGHESFDGFFGYLVNGVFHVEFDEVEKLFKQ